MKRTVVTPENYQRASEKLIAAKFVAFDTETTGLRAYHGDEIFSFSACDGEESFYFDKGCVGSAQWANVISNIFSDYGKAVFLHNAKFDLAMLIKNRWIGAPQILATIHCTLTMARVEHNDYMSYSLDACAERIGLKKDDKVMQWLEENSCYTWEVIPGKQQRRKNWHFDRVPFYLISEYAMIDAEVTWQLGMHQCGKLQSISAAQLKAKAPMVAQVAKNEAELTKTTLFMELFGIKVDLNYVGAAVQQQNSLIEKAKADFQFLTGKEFKASSKVFEEVFESDREHWGFTEKGNPSFDSEHLKKFKHPAAKAVLEYRDAKSKCDFFLGFTYHADADGFVHPNYNQFGTATGRFSSSDPNFQNLTAEETGSDPYPVRRAIIPPSDEFCIVSLDYVAMEYIMLLELAARKQGFAGDLLKRVRDGADVHQATADLVSEKTGLQITRKAAKMTNFLTIYGGGNKKLAEGLGISEHDAKQIRTAIFHACPEIQILIESVSNTADKRKNIFNWMGRVSFFPDYRYCYKALNYLIQGGCADVMKVAMNQCQALISNNRLKSRLVMTIHDELVFYIHRSEKSYVGSFQRILEDAFPAKYIKMRVGVEASAADLDSLVKWDSFVWEAPAA